MCKQNIVCRKPKEADYTDYSVSNLFTNKRFYYELSDLYSVINDGAFEGDGLIQGNALESVLSSLSIDTNNQDLKNGLQNLHEKMRFDNDDPSIMWEDMINAFIEIENQSKMKSMKKNKQTHSVMAQNELQQIWKLMDSKNEGKISTSHLSQIMKIVGQDIPVAVLNQMFTDNDKQLQDDQTDVLISFEQLR